MASSENALLGSARKFPGPPPYRDGSIISEAIHEARAALFIETIEDKKCADLADETIADGAGPSSRSRLGLWPRADHKGHS